MLHRVKDEIEDQLPLPGRSEFGAIMKVPAKNPTALRNPASNVFDNDRYSIIFSLGYIGKMQALCYTLPKIKEEVT